MIQLARDFRHVELARLAQMRLQSQWREANRQDRKLKQAELAEDTAMDFATMVVASTAIAPMHLDLYDQRLDEYEAATLEALMRDQELLAQIQKRIDDRLENATQLPDGRRVLITRDGSQVFDEHGIYVPPEDIDYGTINTDFGFHEDHVDDIKQKMEIQDSINNHHVTVDKIDQAREDRDNGLITEENARLSLKDIRSTMDDSVRDIVPTDEYDDMLNNPDMMADFDAVMDVPSTPSIILPQATQTMGMGLGS